jgi:endonuclease/exonuclease/phosphatase family metal-dependent hydrolase
MSFLSLLQVFFLLLLPVFSFLIMPKLSGPEPVALWQATPTESLLITEFVYNPPGLDEEREWVEVANPGNKAISLAGFGLGDEEQIGGGEGMLRFPEGSEIVAGEAIVVARTAVGFRALFGINPDYEVQDTDALVPDMLVDAQWASGQFALANDGDEIILLDDQGDIIDALSYGDSTVFFTPSIPLLVSGQSAERSPAICDTDSAADWHPQSIPAPGELVFDGQCASVEETSRESRLQAIGEIQGVGDISPFLNQLVTFRGLVTGIIEDQNASGVIFYTIFIQDIPGFEDGDEETSDAVAVFLGRQRPVYRPGDQLQVTGQVTEYFGLTEIDDNGLFIQLESSANALPEPVVLDVPEDPARAIDYLETLEGMRVYAEGWLPVVGPTHAGCGFAVASTPDAARPVRHTGLELYPLPILVLNQSDVDCSALPDVKSGDLVAGVAGPLTYHFEQFKVVQQDVQSLQVEQGDPLPISEASSRSQNWFRVATLNLDNYLAPSLEAEQQQLGHPSPKEFEIKQRKLAYTISHVLDCPELLGVQEVESEELLLELVSTTVDSCSFLYQVTHIESADARGIDVALLSDPRRVSIEEAELQQTCSTLDTGIWDSNINCLPGEQPLFSRPPLEVSLRLDGNPIIILVNHFKSKSGGEIETAPRRQAQAQHVHELVQSMLASDPQADLIVLGDFNDFNRSLVWQQLQEGGVLYDTVQKIPSHERYSYIFDGASQLMDGILVSPALVHRIADVAIMHINADYPIAYAFDESIAAFPYHVSDHDPLVITINNYSPSGEEVSAEQTYTLPETKTLPTVQPSVSPVNDLKATPTIQLAVPDQIREDVGSRQYLAAIAGFAILLVAPALWWLARRRSD